jgi:hypothetical protein
VTVALIALMVLAVIAANLPFLSERVLFVRALPSGSKPLYWRLLELVLLYGLIGLLSWWLEGRFGPVHDQGWQFFVTTFALFLVAAYPGFVVRYFWRKPGL